MSKRIPFTIPACEHGGPKEAVIITGRGPTQEAAVADADVGLAAWRNERIAADIAEEGARVGWNARYAAGWERVFGKGKN